MSAKYRNGNSANGSPWRETLRRPPWRTVVPAVSLLLLLLAGYALWSPGQVVTDGRHDRGRNAAWLQHDWLGDDEWFARYGKEDQKTRFRSEARVREVATLLRAHHITDVFPHLCPTQDDGSVMPVDPEQTRRFLRGMQAAGIRVLPWVGGVRERDFPPGDRERYRRFAASVRKLLLDYPEFAGIHLNVEPWPSGDPNQLRLLDEVRRALPPGRLLSVAAYPPPTRWHAFPEVHWKKDYFKAVAERCDQMAVMMYDTSLRHDKIYQSLMASWTRQELDWTGSLNRPPAILLGLPAYDDDGVGYYHPDVENLRSGLRGIHSGLGGYPSLPDHYQGIALYAEWEMDDAEWQMLRQHFLKL